MIRQIANNDASKNWPESKEYEGTERDTPSPRLVTKVIYGLLTNGSL